MKIIQKGFLFSLVLAVYSKLSAQVIKWDGEGGDGQWNTSANWVGDAIPASGDHVLLDNSVVSGTYTVSLPSGSITTTVLSLTITPSGVNTISLLLPSVNTALPGLSLSGSGYPLVLNNGAVFKNSSGAASGTTVQFNPGDSIRINNGGKYIHNTIRAHSGIVSILSRDAGTEDGTFEFDIPGPGSTFVSLAGRVFGNLVFSGNSAGSKTYTASGSNPVRIRNKFSLNFSSTYIHNISDSLLVYGDVSINAGCILNISNGSHSTGFRIEGNLAVTGTLTETGSANPKVIFNGTSSQDVYVGSGGAISGDGMIIKINNSAGVTLQSSLVIPYMLDFASGHINSSNTGMLIFPDNSTYTGGGHTSHVNGPVMKAGDEDFIFPVGDFGHYLPLKLTNLSAGGTQAVTDTFIVQYFRDNPQSYYGSVVATGLDHVSYVEYWSVEKKSGSVSKYISLAVDSLSFATNADFLSVAQYNGSTHWNDLVNGSFSGIAGPPVATGTITSALSVSSFGIFTLASTHPDPLINPLPVKFIYVNTVKQGSNGLISWGVAEKPLRGTEFIIERSSDKHQFFRIGSEIAGNKHDYFFIDKNLQNGVSYYRIKIKDPNGKIIYSEVVVLVNHNTNVYLLSIFPNPVSDNARLRIYSSIKGKADFFIIDMNGRIVKQIRTNVFVGNSHIVINTSDLSQGTYLITGIVSGERLNSVQFIK